MFIYKIIIKPTQQVYIGLDTKPVYKKSRWKYHCNKSKMNPLTKLHKAMNYYGIDNCEYEVIEEISGNENYMNNGSPIYLLSKDIDQVENQLKNINSNIFSFDFYKSNIKLQTFVYKRFDFNMLEMEYSIDVEDISS